MTTAPIASSPGALKRMQRQRRRDTTPEMAIRRELHRRGLRYRVQVAVLGGRRRQDIVFGAARVVVDVRGCFWHGCPIHGTMPKANAEWWHEKIIANQERDNKAERQLEEAGWTTIVAWEHDDVIEVADRVGHAISAGKTIVG
jgi:DNA mismatch endonuclease, patch repair protein